MVSSVETSLFRPSIYLVWVLGALEALQCIICHYLRTELRNHGRTDGITDGRTDQAFYYNRLSTDGITELRTDGRNHEQIRPSIIIDNEWETQHQDS